MTRERASVYSNESKECFRLSRVSLRRMNAYQSQMSPRADANAVGVATCACVACACVCAGMSCVKEQWERKRRGFIVHYLVAFGF